MPKIIQNGTWGMAVAPRGASLAQGGRKCRPGEWDPSLQDTFLAKNAPNLGSLWRQFSTKSRTNVILKVIEKSRQEKYRKCMPKGTQKYAQRVTKSNENDMCL